MAWMWMSTLPPPAVPLPRPPPAAARDAGVMMSCRYASSGDASVAGVCTDAVVDETAEGEAVEEPEPRPRRVGGRADGTSLKGPPRLGDGGCGGCGGVGVVTAGADGASVLVSWWPPPLSTALL